MRVTMFGYQTWGHRTLQALLDSDHEVVLVVTHPRSDHAYEKIWDDSVAELAEKHGVPVLLNTSFNNNAEPIVQSVHDVLTTYLTTEIDVLVVEDFLVRRRQPVTQALDDLVPAVRPMTRLRQDWRPGEEVSGEVYLDYSFGPSAKVSPTVFNLLAAADGESTVAALAGTLTDEVREELVSLWQQRFFVLSPKP